jgi:acetyl/propionyl-CoA carboxylase alpha subunit/acetyl-CoA carboxylase carboxyltransferase component
MITRLLVANRGEIAVRIMRTASEMGIDTVGVAPVDDAASLHMRHASTSVVLDGIGPAAYLDAAQLLTIAAETGCDAIHPGYGFLSESAAFSRACREAGMAFVGPTADQLAALGDKAQARALAAVCGVPVLEGTSSAVSLAEARAFMTVIETPIMIKALSGGGGRGIRLVNSLGDLDDAFERCQSEALRSFGDERVYVEQALISARHIEVQVLGDGTGAVASLGERDCSLQRRNQKLVEIAPSPAITQQTRHELVSAATRMAAEIGYLNAGTFEFLVEADAESPRFYFLEANPRLQVEHTVTEELWGVDLVRAQLLIASGSTLQELALPEQPRRGYAVQARINMERFLADGSPAMDGGTIQEFELASGPGVRVDTFGYRGYSTNTLYDSLLAKVIVSTTGPNFSSALGKTARALSECVVEGVPTNISLLRAVLARSEITSGALTTRFVDRHMTELLEQAAPVARAWRTSRASLPSGLDLPATSNLPLGVLGAEAALSGTVVSVVVAPNQIVLAGQQVVVIESMKMEHVVIAPAAGRVLDILVARGSAVQTGQLLVSIAVDETAEAVSVASESVDLDSVRPDLAELLVRQAGVLDAGRPEAVARRRAKNASTARDNVAALVDDGTFLEYGSLAVAGQRRRRSLEELVAKTPADGVVVGFGAVNGTLFDPIASRSLVIAFDETVLAGTMGEIGRSKLKHALAVASQDHRPVVLFAEGGGGRAGDTDGHVSVTGWTMDVSAYHQLGQMSGLTPLIGITTGRCFAANAGLLACCDVIISTENANLGVGGPAMIEGGRLGEFTPEEIGPVEVQSVNGVIDILVPDEAAAVETAKRYLSYFQGPLDSWDVADQRALRFVVPENRLRAYDVRKVITALADVDSVLELRCQFGVGMVTSLIRVEGRPLGVLANNPLHLGGAIDSDAADKASRFMRLCEAFGLPILMLCDTPGVMVGPEAEKSATVRKMGRMFVTGANLTVPLYTIVLRKAYGIGAELMAGGWFKAPRFVVSWPTGEFGGMNIEGNVKLGYSAELDAIADEQARQERFEEIVAELHSSGRALTVATQFEIDDVIDPAESRSWISSAMSTHRGRPMDSDKTVPYVDPW